MLSRRLDQIRTRLACKGADYAIDGDRLHNFREAAKLRGGSNADALLGMLVKHWVSVQDMVRDKAKGVAISRAKMDEKIGDAINYLVLLEAVLVEGK